MAILEFKLSRLKAVPISYKLVKFETHPVLELTKHDAWEKSKLLWISRFK
jgi:hypothetical protein